MKNEVELTVHVLYLVHYAAVLLSTDTGYLHCSMVFCLFLLIILYYFPVAIHLELYIYMSFMNIILEDDVVF